MKFQGLKLDNPTGVASIGTWSWAKDMLLGKGFDYVTNEKDNTTIYQNYQSSVNDTDHITASFALPSELILFTTVFVNGEYQAQIIRITDTDTTLIFSTTIFGNQGWIGKEIDCVYLYNNKKELILIFTDNVLSPIVLNLGTITSPTIYPFNNISDLDSHYLFPKFNQTNIKLNSVESNGNLKAGVYYIALCYVLDEEVNTSFGPISNPIMLVKDGTAKEYDYFQGSINNDVIFKSITIGIDNLDARYKQFRLGIIKDNLAYLSNIYNIFTLTTTNYHFTKLSKNNIDRNTVIAGQDYYGIVTTTSFRSNIKGQLSELRIYGNYNQNTYTESPVILTEYATIYINDIIIDSVPLSTLSPTAYDNWFIYTLPTPIDIDLYDVIKIHTGNKQYGTFNGSPGTLGLYKNNNSSDINTANPYIKYLGQVSTMEGAIQSSGTTFSYIDITIRYIDALNTPTSSTITIDNLNDLRSIPLSDIIIPTASYETVKSLAYCNNRLRLANTSSIPYRSITDIYNKLIKYVKLTWTYEDVVSLDKVENSYKDPIAIFNKRGFRKDEVYAFYLKLTTHRGEEYGTYHIPMHDATGEYSSVRDIVVYDTGDINNEAFNKYQVNDTCIYLGNNEGEFGYWENKNENYPIEFGLGNVPVRHFKFPSTAFIYNNLHLYTEGIIYSNPYDDLIISSYTQSNYFNLEESMSEYWAPEYNSGLGIDGWFVSLVPSVLSGVLSSYAGQNTFIYPYATITITNPLHTATTRDGGDYYNYGPTNTAVGTKYSATIDQSISISCNINLYDYYNINFRVYDAFGAYDASRSFRFHGASGTNFLNTLQFTLKKGEYIEIIIFSQSANSSTKSLNIHVSLPSLYSNILGVKPFIDWTAIEQNDNVFYNEIKQYCNSFELLYAERNSTDSLIIDQSIVKQDLTNEQYTGTSSIALTTQGSLHQYLRFYGVDSMINTLNIQPMYIKQITALPYVPSINNNAPFKTNLLEIENTIPLSYNYFKKIKKIQYVLPYNTSTIPSNLDKDNCYIIETMDAKYGGFDNCICNIFTIKNNCYLDFTNKRLVSTGISIPIDSNITKVYGGDTYINKLNIITNLKINTYLSAGKTKYFSSLANLQFICESTSNLGFRYTGSNIWEKYYPFYDTTHDIKGMFIDSVGDGNIPLATKQRAGDIYRITSTATTHSTLYNDGDYMKALVDDAGSKIQRGTLTRDQGFLTSSFPIPGELEVTGYANYFLYDNIFNSVNNVKQFVINSNYDTNIVYRYPTLIHSSSVQPNVIGFSYFRKFLTLDKYIMPNGKGEIIKLSYNNRILFIQHEHSLYRAFVLDKLANENIDTYLKSGEIFDRLPEELFFDNNSYINCDFQSAAKMTPFGYVVIDTIEGYIYMVTDKVESITKAGIENWFKDRIRNMKFVTNAAIGYDKDNDRLLFTIRTNSSVLPFTLSYHVENKTFISFHRYELKDYIWNNNGIYSLTDNGTIDKLGTTYTTSNGDPFIDFVFNAEYKFILHNINWITSVFDQYGNRITDDTISDIVIFNKEQCSNKISLLKLINGELLTGIEEITEVNGQLTKVGNLKYSYGKYRFSEFTDELADSDTVFIKNATNNNLGIEHSILSNSTIFPPSKNWYDKLPISGTSIVVRLYYNNRGYQRQLLIHNIDINATEYR